MTVIGIDLGTTNSAVATTDANGITTTLADRDGARFIPSVVYFAPDGTAVVGDRAKSMAVMEPDRVAMLFKRGMGESTFLFDGSDFAVDGKVWRPEELSSLVLKKMKQMAEEHVGQVTGAIVTVPAYFGEPERAATRDAAELAGLPILRILNEPTAAAIAHGIDAGSRGKTILVFDLGGGTFDVTVMRVDGEGEMQVLSTRGNHRLGGADFDNEIMQMIAQKAQEEAGVDIFAEPWTFQDAREKAEDIKKELSTLETSSRPISTGGRPIMFTLTRTEFEAAISDTVEDVSDMVEITLGESGLDASEIDTVLMVGGSSRIPAFAQLLHRMFGKEPTFSRNLDEDVARGASVLAAKIGGQIDPRSELAELAIPKDVASHGLGMTVNDEDDREINGIVVRPGQGVPSKGSRTFYASADGQTEVRLRINEGDEEDLAFVRQIGEGLASFGRPVHRGYPIRIDISYTEEQIVEVYAYDGETGQLIGEVRLERTGSMSGDEKRQAIAAITGTGVQ